MFKGLFDMIKIYEFSGNSSIVFKSEFSEFMVKSSILFITATLVFDTETVL